MPYPTLTFPQQLPEQLRWELELLLAQIQGYLSHEHKGDGSHGDVTADSATVAGAVSAGGAVTATGAVSADDGAVLLEDFFGLQVGVVADDHRFEHAAIAGHARGRGEGQRCHQV